eukprot:TRINITY_DN12466_c0_g1_i1.p1 TRINITY_DN12466_c0_g1~~TRINITY_DN12466_c0_g1_i1.p1  ORF type:complete len:496 (-),score=126.69 TRINITY_DN12466_c0_g1_i1:352-1839(-)
MLVPNGAKVWDGNGWNALVDDDSLPKPHPPHSERYKDPNATIFIGVSAFRDKRCPKTLYNYFSKAKNPHRLRVGLVQQNSISEDPDCLQGYCDLMKADEKFATKFGDKCPYKEQIKITRVEAKLAAGPCYGRHMQSYMLRDEEFCMQTDSHMDVVPEWDVEMAAMWGRTENEYGVLTTYVHVKESIGTLEQAKDRNKLVPHLCQVSFTGGNNPRYVQAKLAKLNGRPKLTTSWAAGFSFAKCHAWRAAPYDPHLKMVFDGEEFSMAARLWTRGYDFYTPDFSLIGHDYNRPTDGPSPGSWVSNPGLAEAGKKAHKRLRALLGILGEPQPEGEDAIGKYGLGTKRSFQQFQEFVGANTTTLEILNNRCNSIAWVPFKEEWPPTENNLGGPYWEAVFKHQARQALPDPAAEPQAADAQAVGIITNAPIPSQRPIAVHAHVMSDAAANAHMAGAAELGTGVKLLLVLGLTAAIVAVVAMVSKRPRPARRSVLQRIEEV